MSPHLLGGFCRCLCDSGSDLFPPRVPEGSDKKEGGGMLEVFTLMCGAMLRTDMLEWEIMFSNELATTASSLSITHIGKFVL